ncbi:hypothetical protein SAMN04515671_4283 [Nakamurella panacisegetis]|uniref:Uncharacterized protein n=1 Tax=Nakamurella panacisegetis TaxID=1090615 RepID=A0A1H0SUS7_9ACTN|nr:hypothetical protein [Nakamurella panacisegetis]SDP45036.1 hypothetical protein SAMN04515671_4283 [Nakamurella panacisegetis]
MTTHQTYLLSNLSVNQFIEFQVAATDDVLTAARERLGASGLPEDVQGGFFVSVYPTGAQTTEPDGPGPAVAPDTEAVAPDTGAVGSDTEAGALASAASQGPMDWPEGDRADASRRSDDGDGEVPYVVVPLGGH